MNQPNSSALPIVAVLLVLFCLGAASLAVLAWRQRAVAMAYQEAALRREQAAQAKLKDLAAQESARARAAKSNIQSESSQRSAAIAEIQARLKDQEAAWNRGDIEAFMKAYWRSEELTFASAGKVTRGWQSTFDGYKRKYPDLKTMGKLTFGDLEHFPQDDDVMLVLGTWQLERENNPVGGNFSLVWRRIKGSWLIVHDHTSVKPDEQSN